MSRIRNITTALALSAVLASCSGSGEPRDSAVDSSIPSTDRPSIAVAFFPIEDIVRGVGGDAVDIVRLVAPGRPAHDAELTAAQLNALSSSDAVFYLGENFQPSVEKAIGSLPSTVTSVDLYSVAGVTHLEVDKKTSSEKKDDDHDHNHGDEHDAEDHDDHDHGDEDPHVWLDPSNMAAMARAVAATLTTIAPEAKTTIESNLTAYITELETLGRDIDAAFTTCTSRTLVTAHDAFGHFARRARLTTASITGVNPQDEPSAKELQRIADIARTSGVTTVFFEQALPADLSRAVANAIGAKVDVLDTLETVSASSLSAGATYDSLMRDNIMRIATGLGCV